MLQPIQIASLKDLLEQLYFVLRFKFLSKCVRVESRQDLLQHHVCQLRVLLPRRQFFHCLKQAADVALDFFQK